MSETMIVDEEKEIAQLIVTSLLWEATMPMYKFDIKHQSKNNIQRLYNGKGQMINLYDKWASAVAFSQISQAERNSLKAIYDLKTAFIIILEPYDYNGNYDKPEELYRVLWTSPWEQKYTTTIKGNGYNIPAQLEEV